MSNSKINSKTAESLGYTYDIFENNLESSLRIELFDWNRIFSTESEDTINEHTTYTDLQTNDYKQIEDYNSESKISTTNINSNITGIIKALTLGLSYARKESTFTQREKYASKMRLCTKNYRVAFDYEYFKQYVKSNVQKDIDTMPAEKLFNKYGSHFLINIFKGGYLEEDISISKELYKATVSNSIGFSAIVNYKGKKAASGSVDVAFENEVKKFNQNSEAKIKTAGKIDQIFANYAANNPNTAITEPKADILCMLDSTKNNESLSGIWNLATTSVRSEELESYFKNTWFINQLLLRTLFIEDVIAVAGTSSTNAPKGYERINFDLNKGAKGAYIYLAIKVKTGSEIIEEGLNVVTALNATNNRENLLNDGFIKIDVDLNMGAKGNYIYLWKKFNPKKGDLSSGITDIQVIGVSNPSYAVNQFTAPYIRINQDFNEGAKGEFIYIYYK